MKNKREYSSPHGDSVFPVEERDESEITQAGVAGFYVARNSATVYWWHDRGKTWSSLKLDRMDAARNSFSEQSTGKKESVGNG